MQGRLNIFQKSMLQWNDLHPYNAIHVVRIPAPLDLEQLKKVIGRRLEQERLASVFIDRRAGTYSSAPSFEAEKTISGSRRAESIIT